jgi:dipeptidyl aminopeptidase/acylaminoacyl peptidase
MLRLYDIERDTLTTIPSPSSVRASSSALTLNALSGEPEVRHIDGHTVLFVPGYYVAKYTLPALFRVDLKTMETKMLETSNGGTLRWLINDAGELVARQDYDGTEHLWSVSTRQPGGQFKVAISGHESIDVPSLLAFNVDGESLIMESFENGNRVWRPLSLKEGTLGGPMTQKGDQSIVDPQTGRLLGTVTEDGARYEFVDAAIQRHWDAIGRAYAGERVHLESFTNGFTKVVVSVDGPRDGYAYELVDLSAKRSDPIGDIYQGITKPLPVEALEYRAADGLRIPGYLTFPADQEPKNLPLVVLAHGGPASHDTADFDWWSQALASQGYAVLRANFRGSDLGEEFMAAGYGEFGRKMQSDLSDGVRYLAERGTIDPTRVCIVGASYGGYAALAGITLQRGIYRCAVAVAGISDLHRMLRFDDPDDLGEKSHAVRYWDRYLGVHDPSDPALDTISPVRRAGAVGVPLLMIHGADDTVVAYSQSREMLDALREHGCMRRGIPLWIARRANSVFGEPKIEDRSRGCTAQGRTGGLMQSI